MCLPKQVVNQSLHCHLKICHRAILRCFHYHIPSCFNDWYLPKVILLTDIINHTLPMIHVCHFAHNIQIFKSLPTSSCLWGWGGNMGLWGWKSQLHFNTWPILVYFTAVCHFINWTRWEAKYYICSWNSGGECWQQPKG